MTQPPTKAFSSQWSTWYYVNTNPNGAEKNWPARVSEVTPESRFVVWARKGGSAGLAVIALVETAVVGTFTVLSLVVYPVSSRPYRFCVEWLQESALTILWNAACAYRVCSSELNVPTHISIMRAMTPWATKHDFRFVATLPEHARHGVKFKRFSEEWVLVHSREGACVVAGMGDRNSVFEAEGKKYVLHKLEPGNELYMMNALARRDLGPKIFASFPEQNRVLMEYIDHPTITPEEAAPHCKKIGEILDAIHDIPLSNNKGKGIEVATQERCEYIREQADLYQTELSKSLLAVTEEAMKVFTEGMVACNRNLVVNINTDPHPRNLFWVDGRDKNFVMIDWESACHGHPYFDVASLAIFLGMDKKQEAELLEGYFVNEPTANELEEYKLMKRVRWAYTCIVNAMWAYRVLAKLPKAEVPNDVPAPDKDFRGYMQFWGERKGEPLEFFVNVSRLARREI